MTDESVVDSGPAGACPDCGAETLAGDRFCENCGNDLLLVTAGTPDTGTVPAPRGCVACGGPDKPANDPSSTDANANLRSDAAVLKWVLSDDSAEAPQRPGYHALAGP